MEETRSILLVKRWMKQRSRLVNTLEREGYQTRVASSLEEVGDIVNGKERISLALVDVTGFTRAVWNQFSYLREAGISYVVLAPCYQAALQQSDLVQAAQCIVVKPLHLPVLMELVHHWTSTVVPPFLSSSSIACL